MPFSGACETGKSTSRSFDRCPVAIDIPKTQHCSPICDTVSPLARDIKDGRPSALRSALVNSVARSSGKNIRAPSQLHDLGGAGDAVAQPVGPLAAENMLPVPQTMRVGTGSRGEGGFDR